MVVVGAPGIALVRVPRVLSGAGRRTAGGQPKVGRPSWRARTGGSTHQERLLDGVALLDIGPEDRRREVEGSGRLLCSASGRGRRELRCEVLGSGRGSARNDQPQSTSVAGRLRRAGEGISRCRPGTRSTRRRATAKRRASPCGRPTVRAWAASGASASAWSACGQRCVRKRKGRRRRRKLTGAAAGAASATLPASSGASGGATVRRRTVSASAAMLERSRLESKGREGLAAAGLLLLLDERPPLCLPLGRSWPPIAVLPRPPHRQRASSQHRPLSIGSGRLSRQPCLAPRRSLGLTLLSAAS